jgi:hypothetical protein
MVRIAPVFSGIVRYGGSLALLLGLMIWIDSSVVTPWAGASASLTNFHMLLGILAVLALWLLAAAYAMTGRASMGIVIGAVVVGLLQAILGVTQEGLLVNSAHWIIEVLHLLLGIGVIGSGERITMMMKKLARPAVS